MTAHAPLADLLMVVHRAGGESAVRAFTKALGGKLVYIPKKATPNQALALAAGMKVAEAVVAAYGGDRIAIPKGRAALRRLVAAEIEANGGSLNTLAVAADVSFSRARQLRREARAQLKAGKIVVPARKAQTRQMDIEDFLAKG